MTDSLPFEYSFTVRIEPDLAQSNAEVLLIGVTLAKPATPVDVQTLSRAVNAFVLFFQSGALSIGQNEPDCEAFEPEIINDAVELALTFTPITHSALIVLLNLIQETQGEALISQVTLSAETSANPPAPMPVAETAFGVYTPQPQSVPFDCDIDNVMDTVNLIIVFQNVLTQSQTDAVINAFQFWFVGFDQGAYRLDAAGADAYAIKHPMQCANNTFEWSLTRFKADYAAIESFVHIGVYLHHHVAAIAQLVVGGISHDQTYASKRLMTSNTTESFKTIINITLTSERIADVADTDEQLYVLFNGAAHDGFLSKLHALERNPQYHSLYQNTSLQDVKEQAQYIVSTQHDSTFCQWLMTQAQAKDNTYPILLTSVFDLEILRLHWSSLAFVEQEGSRVMFRLSSPSIMRAWLASSDQASIATFMGPAYTLWLPNGQGEWTVYLNTDPPEDYPVAKIQPAPWLPITEANLAAFDRVMENSFIQRIIHYLEENHPETVEGYEEGDLDPMIATGIRRAKRYGIRQESSITTFIANMFLIAPNFDEQPNIRAGLTNPMIDPDDRLDWTIDHTTQQDWREADDGYDDAAWEFE